MKNVALITGASTGIGRELARIHAEKGFDSIIVSTSIEDLNKVKTEFEASYGTKVICIEQDLSLPDAGTIVYNKIKDMDIEIEFLINNAGFGGQGYFHERPWQKDMAMINVNVMALTELTRLYLPEFIERNRGRILNTSSTASYMPGPLQAVYYASKSYVSYFSNAIAIEVEDTNVTVTALLPGAVNSSFGAASGMEKTDLFKKTVEPIVVARDGYKGMMEGKLNVVSGVPPMLRISLGLSKFLPRKTLLRMVKKRQSV